MLRLTKQYPENRQYLTDFNKQSLTFTYTSGSQIIFASFDNEGDAKMTDIDNAYMNEANAIKNGFAIFNQLSMQVKRRIYIDYNPVAPFWAHNKLINKPGVRLFITDHRHNTFLTPEQHEAIETQYPKGSELFRVYARGLTGRMEGSIYKNWSTVNEFPPCEQVIWG
jgi:phage terminase large subunit